MGGAVTVNLESLAAVLHGPAADEVDRMLDELCPDDLSAGEMVTLATVLASAYERKQLLEVPPADLKLVRARKRKRT